MRNTITYACMNIWMVIGFVLLTHFIMTLNGADGLGAAYMLSFGFIVFPTLSDEMEQHQEEES